MNTKVGGVLQEPILKKEASCQHEETQSTFFKRDYSELEPEEYGRRKLREQVKVYLITYIAYALIHFERVFWSMSKSFIKKGPY